MLLNAMRHFYTRKLGEGVVFVKFWKILALTLAALLMLLPVAALADQVQDAIVPEAGETAAPDVAVEPGAPALTADGAQVTVNGTGIVTLKPDTATIILGVSETAKGAVQAQSTVNKKISAIKKALVKAGAKESDISVSDLSVWGNYDYSGGQEQKLVGYTASHTLNITVSDMGKVGPLIDASLSAGANQLQGVTFSVKNNDSAYDQALKLAVEKAREKAEVLAAASGVRLGAVRTLTEGTDYGYNPYPAAKYAENDMGAGAAPTQVDTGMVTVSATVTVVYSLEG